MNRQMRMSAIYFRAAVACYTSLMPATPDQEILQTRIQSIYRASPAGMGIVAHRVFLEVNEKLCAMTGYTAAELIGRSSRMLYLTDDEFAKVGTSGSLEIRQTGIMTTETRWKRKDGTVIDVVLGSSPIRPGDADSDITFIALDITEHKRALCSGFKNPQDSR